MSPAFVVLSALAGLSIVLVVIWLPGFMAIRVSEQPKLGEDSCEESRFTPSDELLKELHDIAVSFPRYDDVDDAEVLKSADALLSGTYSPYGTLQVGVPFRPGYYVFGTSGWHLDLHSFAIPSLLARAYEVSGDHRFLEEAVRYVIDWASYESSLWLPLGFTFNDHAIAARSVVAVEVWRLYRSSTLFEQDTAASYLRYIMRLMQLLMREELYTYSTNHGVMQSLSLLHLGIAFPELPNSQEAIGVGAERLESQLAYYLNAEGVILEHSASYHVNGLKRLAAAWRYLGLANIPVSSEMIARYWRALQFGAALLRPDLTLPVVGDTGSEEHTAYLVAEFDDDGIVSEPLRSATSEDLSPSLGSIHPAAGFAVVWDGLDDWPDGHDLSQTVLHWGNFPSQNHKHADELALTLWSRETNWLRGLGYWPYDQFRRTAIGWRSSNAPHWLGEDADSSRNTLLRFSAVTESATFFDLVRRNDDGRSIGRQLIKPNSRTWIVIDTFSTDQPGEVETIWKFSPSLALEAGNGGEFRLSGGNGALDIRVQGSGSPIIEADPEGDAPWNMGVVAADDIVDAPALRVSSDHSDGYMVIVFRLASRNEPSGLTALAVDWKSPSAWSLNLNTSEGELELERTADVLSIVEGEEERRLLELSVRADARTERAKVDALSAYRAAEARFDGPFQLLLPKRVKASLVALFAATLHIGALLFVRRRYSAWSLPLFATASVCWLGLAFYVPIVFLA